MGTITQSKPARSFGRAGRLRFDFRELRLPGATSTPVQGTLAGANSIKSEKLKIDSEGGVQPQPQNRVIVPLVSRFSPAALWIVTGISRRTRRYPRTALELWDV